MRVAIVGSRSVQLEQEQELLRFLPRGTHEIVSGGAEGADKIAEHIAERLGLPIKIFRPDYETYYRRAPLERNLDIIRYSDFVLALWDGSSRGTAHVIKSCVAEYTPVRVLICHDGRLMDTLFGEQDHLL